MLPLIRLLSLIMLHTIQHNNKVIMSYSDHRTANIRVPLNNNSRREKLDFLRFEDDVEIEIEPAHNTRADMEASYAAQEAAFDGFIGGIEVPIGTISKKAANAFQPEDGGELTYEEIFVCKPSLNGESAVIILGTKLGPGSWTGISNSQFYKIANAKSISSVLSRSETIDLLNSPEYKPAENI